MHLIELELKHYIYFQMGLHERKKKEPVFLQHAWHKGQDWTSRKMYSPVYTDGDKIVSCCCLYMWWELLPFWEEWKLSILCVALWFFWVAGCGLDADDLGVAVVCWQVLQSGLGYSLSSKVWRVSLSLVSVGGWASSTSSSLSWQKRW